MTEIYAVNSSSFDQRVIEENSLVTTMLSALLIIGLPTAFWMGVIELANVLFGLDLSITTRLMIGAVLVSLLFVVWCFVSVAARQSRSAELDAILSGSPAGVD